MLLPFAFPLGIYGVLSGSRRARATLVLGALGPALLLGAWNHVRYGAPWALPDLDQGASGLADVARENSVFSLSLPTPRRLFEVLFGVRRGIFVFAPVLALGVAGLKPLWRRDRALSALLASVALLAALQAAAKPISWHGGTAAGPRYLYSLPRELHRPRAVAATALAAWIGLSFPYLLFGTRGASRTTIRRDEVRRFVLREPEPLRLRARSRDSRRD